MKHIAYRIDTQTIKENRVIEGWFVRGQRNTDYNWPMLYEANSYEDALEHIKNVRTVQPVYAPSGYTINI